MKILVATMLGQGTRASDFHHARDGEILIEGFMCDRDRLEGPDGGCGCRRAFSGIQTRKATTTALVASSTMTRAQYLEQVIASETRAWPGIPTDTIRREILRQLAAVMGHEVGAVLEKRGSVVRVRGRVGDDGGRFVVSRLGRLETRS